MKDPWVHSLVQLEPRYFELKDMVENGMAIYPVLSKRGSLWCITLQEKFGITDDANNYYPTTELHERISWTTAQLEQWVNVKRMEHNRWHFKRKSDAKKFQTLYNLKWA